MYIFHLTIKLSEKKTENELNADAIATAILLLFYHCGFHHIGFSLPLSLSQQFTHEFLFSPSKHRFIYSAHGA